MKGTQTRLIDYTQHQPRSTILAESRERLKAYGSGVLSPTELLSIVINGDAGSLWQRYQSLSAIARAPLQELVTLPGIGPAAVCRLKAAAELGVRLAQEQQAVRPQILSPDDVANLLMLEMRDLEQEQLRVLLLNTKNYLISVETIYVGSVHTTVIRIGEVLRPAVRLNATATIVVHNHPSGDPSPSPEDIQLTRLIAQGGKLLGIDVLDHIIIGHNRYVSLKERGVCFD